MYFYMYNATIIYRGREREKVDGYVLLHELDGIIMYIHIYIYVYIYMCIYIYIYTSIYHMYILMCTYIHM